MTMEFINDSSKWKDTGMVRFYDSEGNEIKDTNNEYFRIIDPSVIEWGYSDISGSNAGRDEKGTMHPMKIGHKIQYKLEWNNIDPANASYILYSINKYETFKARLYNPAAGDYETRTYYVGDRSAPFKMWRPSERNGAILTKLSFTIIEV